MSTTPPTPYSTHPDGHHWPTNTPLTLLSSQAFLYLLTLNIVWIYTYMSVLFLFSVNVLSLTTGVLCPGKSCKPDSWAQGIITLICLETRWSIDHVNPHQSPSYSVQGLFFQSLLLWMITDQWRQIQSPFDSSVSIQLDPSDPSFLCVLQIVLL